MQEKKKGKWRKEEKRNKKKRLREREIHLLRNRLYAVWIHAKFLCSNLILSVMVFTRGSLQKLVSS